jgi:hypothetical protein
MAIIFITFGIVVFYMGRQEEARWFLTLGAIWIATMSARRL